MQNDYLVKVVDVTSDVMKSFRQNTHRIGIIIKQ